MASEEKHLRAIAMRKQCNPGCKLFDKCPYMSTAQAYRPDPDKGETDDFRPCLLKEYGSAEQIRMINIYLQGEQGILNEIHRVLYDLGTKAELTGKQEKYLDSLLRYYKLVFVDNKDRGKAQDNLIEVKVVESEGKYSAIPPDQEEEVPTPTDEDDPESLMFSPKLTRIVKRD